MKFHKNLQNLHIFYTENLREFFLHDEFLVAAITSENQWLVANVIVTVFVQFMLEIIFVADGEVDLALPLLGDLQNTVSPVVCSLSILDVIDGEVSDDQRILEFANRVTCTISNQSVSVGESAILINYVDVSQ